MIEMGGSGKQRFGYWCWKPFIILETLKQINDNDILIYADIGCEFNINNKHILQDLIKDTDKEELIGVFGNPIHKEHTWNKADFLAYYDLLDNKDFLNSTQIWGCYLLKNA